MDPAVMKTVGDPKGEVKLSFKYNEKRGALLVKVVSARDLSAKDLRGNSIDPYVKVIFRFSSHLILQFVYF